MFPKLLNKSPPTPPLQSMGEVNDAHEYFSWVKESAKSRMNEQKAKFHRPK
jgi:hypothetical protein